MKSPGFVYLLFICFSLVSLSASAQREATHWYFGKKAGLLFNSDQVAVPLESGRMLALEGCATISDSLGNLLFYTSGDTVYNKFHLKMNNGWLLSGHQSASQSSVIVQEPYSSRYYLFTVDALGGSNGLRYSIIDTDLTGRVVAKNIPLQTPVSEKITAVDHRYTRDAWVIVHGSGTQNDNFYAYRVTKPQPGSGSAILPPVVSRVGISHAGTYPNNRTIGYMKASPDGRKLALAMQDQDLVEIYDFNDSSGVVSNPVQIKSLTRAYGIEFSRDGSKLYVSTQFADQNVEYFNLEAGNGNPDSIRFSRKIIGSTTSLYAAALQLSQNGKIYVANTEPTAKDRQYLSIIQYPDSLWKKAVFSKNMQRLTTNLQNPIRTSEQGLPNFNQSYLWFPGFKFSRQCLGDSTIFGLLIKRKFKNVSWNFGDPNSGASNTSNALNPKHQFSAPNTYLVTLTVTLLNNRVRSISLPVTISKLPTVFLGLDKIVCPGEEVTLTGPNDMTKYHWSTGAVSKSITINKPGTYWLDVTNTLGCTNRSTISIATKPGPQIFSQKVVETCAYVPTRLQTLYQSPGYLWGNGSTESSLVVNREGWYKVTVPYNGCKYTDSIQVVFKECPEMLMIPNVVTPNGDGQNDHFMIRGILSQGWHLQVYNRWGALLFEDKNYRSNWPQQAPPDGAYFYLLQKTGSDIRYKGWIEVTR